MLAQVALELRRSAPPEHRRSKVRPAGKDEVDAAVVIAGSSCPVGRMSEDDQRLVERVERAGFFVLFDGAQGGGFAEGEDTVRRDEACEGTSSLVSFLPARKSLGFTRTDLSPAADDRGAGASSVPCHLDGD